LSTAAFPDAWGFSLFCDDVRSEIAGKTTLVGLYQTDMIFTNDPPYLIPKFVIYIKYYERQKTMSDDLVFGVYLPGDEQGKPTHSSKLPRQSVPSDLPEPEIPFDEDQERVINLTVPLVFSPLVLQKEGFIKVRALCGDTTIKLGSLLVRKVKKDEKIPGLNA